MKFFRKTDLIVIAALLAAGLAFGLIYRYINAGRPVKAEIYYQSQLIETVYLTEGTDRQFSIPQKPNVVFRQSPDKSIRFEISDCPDKICVRTGKIHMTGESAACLPNGIIIKIVSDKRQNDSEPDIVIG